MFEKKDLQFLENEVKRQSDIIKSQSVKLEVVNKSMLALNERFDLFKREVGSCIEKSHNYDILITYLRLKRKLVDLLAKKDYDYDQDLFINNLLIKNSNDTFNQNIVKIFPHGMAQKDFYRYYRDLEHQYLMLTN
jgi:hypothetical protein